MNTTRYDIATPMRVEQDLNELLADAAARGLTHLTLFRVGTSAIMWQASSRCRGDDAYRVAIEADPVDALCSVMGPRVVPAAVSVSSASAEPEDIFG